MLVNGPYASVFAHRPDGKVYFFNRNVNNWYADSDITDQLLQLKSTDGSTIGWRYFNASDAAIEEYDAAGQLLKITRRDGMVERISYADGNGGISYSSIPSATGYQAPLCGGVSGASIPSVSGQLACVSDNFGRQLNFAYDAQGRIMRMSDPSGGIYRYVYDTNGNLATVIYPDSTQLTYSYAEIVNTSGVSLPNALTGISDQNGVRFATFEYDASGRANSTQHANGVEKYQFGYTIDSRGVVTTTTVTDPLGTQRSFNFQTTLGVAISTGQSQPGGSGCNASSSALTYDANGNLASRTDFNGNVTKYSYDLTRNLETQRVEAFGKPQARTISTQWHGYWRLPTQIAEPLKRTTYVYNGDTFSGSVVTCAPTGATIPGITGGTQPIGVLCQKIEQATTDTMGAQGFSAAAAGTPRTWNWTHNQYGQILTADGPRTDVTDVTTYSYYDAADQDMGKRGNLASVTNALGQTTRVTAYDLNGRPTSIVDPNDATTTLTYDARGRLTSKSVGGETTAYTYDPVGQLTQVSLPDSSSLSYTYDSAHRLEGIADGLGNRISYTLDAIGNHTKEDVFDPTGQLAQTRSRVFDALNRLFKNVGAQNQTTTYAYDANGNLTGITDPLNRLTVQSFDALNRLIRITDPGSGQTQFGYNGQAKLVQVTDPRNLVTAYTLDGLGNQTVQQSPDTGTTSQTFDAAGNVKTRTDAKGQTTQYIYDVLNRLTQATLADGSRQIYTWDLGTYGIGRLAQISEQNAAGQETLRTEYLYDDQGRVVRETRTLGAMPYVTAYAYSSGRLATMTYPSGRRVDYTYDAAGRITQITATPSGGQAQVIVSQVTYQPFGGVKSFTYGNSQTYTRSYDQDGRITAYTQGNATQALGYDSASRITFQMDAAAPANIANYTYDNLDRVTSAVLASANYGYVYDATGNRTVQTVVAASIPYSVSPTSNQVQSIGGSPPRIMSYDANGSIVNDGNTQYIYDVRGRLSQVVTANGATNYQLNAQGERIRKSAATTDRLYHYDRQGRLIAEGGLQGQIDREYIYLNDLPVAVVVE